MPNTPKPELTPRERSLLSKPAEWLVAAWQRLRRAWIRFAEINQNAPWFPFALGALCAFDAFIVVVPGDVVAALAVLSNPRDWKRLGVACGVGSALGAFLLYAVIHHFGKGAVDQMTPGGVEMAHLSAARGFFHEYGLFSLALGSVIPGFTWPPVVMAGLSTDQWHQVLAWLVVGRCARFLLIGFGVREGWAMFQAVRHEAKELKDRRQSEGEGEDAP